jgi:hypothetical protein
VIKMVANSLVVVGWYFLSIHFLVKLCSSSLDHVKGVVFCYQGWVIFFGSCTRNRGSKSHKGDGIDGILKENEAAQVASNITNDSSAETNENDGNDETGIPIGNSYCE